MILSVPSGIDDAELGVEEDETLATLLRNHSGPNLIDSVIVSSKINSIESHSSDRFTQLINFSPGAIISSLSR